MLVGTQAKRRVFELQGKAPKAKAAKKRAKPEPDADADDGEAEQASSGQSVSLCQVMKGL